MRVHVGNLPGQSGPCGGPAVSFAQGRNRFRGARYLDTDFSVMKNTKIPCPVVFLPQQRLWQEPKLEKIGKGWPTRP
jgi:hypothetical protein